MNPCSNPSRAPREIPIADLHKTFTTQIATLDPQRAQSVAGLAAARATKAATLAHEQKLLVRKLGPNDPRVAALARQQTRNATLQTSLQAEAVRAQTPAPTVTARSYVFHGFVFDCDRKPLPGLTVALYDDQNQWISEFGFGCTDERGYFLLRVDRTKQTPPPPPPPPPPPSTKIPSPEPAPAPAPKGDVPMQAPASAPASSRASAGIEIQRGGQGATDTKTGDTFDANILVFDRDQKLLHRECQPLHPQLGHVDYRVIVICDESGTCTPPPADTPPRSPGQNPLPVPPPTKLSSLHKSSASAAPPAASPAKAAKAAERPAAKAAPAKGTKAAKSSRAKTVGGRKRRTPTRKARRKKK